jgi:hypothetical protein
MYMLYNVQCKISMKLIPKSGTLYIWSPEPVEVQSSRNEGEKMDPYFANGLTIEDVNMPFHPFKGDFLHVPIKNKMLLSNNYCYNLKDVGTYN